MVLVNGTTILESVGNPLPELISEANTDNTTENNNVHSQVINSESVRIVVEAGPGTGKSYALRLRVQRLILGGILPSRIMAVTFTRTAANDLRLELAKIVHDDGQELCAGTLHGFCFTTLASEHYFSLNGRIPRPILTASRGSNLGFEAAPLLSDLNSSVYKEIYGNATEKSKAIRLFEAAWAKDQAATPELTATPADIQYNADVISWLRFHKAMLIGELIPLTLQYFRTNPLAPELEKFDHVLVDEYQDLNKAEQILIDHISTNASCIAVGDVDQSIYSFRHAQPEGLADFPARHPETALMTLDRCRRCPPNVVALASAIIGQNYNPVEIDRLRPHEGNVDGIISFRQWLTIDDQLLGAMDYVKWLIEHEGLDAKDILILSPSRKLGYALRKLLREDGVEAQSYFTEEALEDDEAQRAFILLTLLSNPDDYVALRSWLGHGSVTHHRREYSKLRLYCEENGTSPKETLEEQVQHHTLNIPKLVASYNELKVNLLSLSTLIGEDLVDALFPVLAEWSNDFRSMAGTPISETLDAKELYDLLLEQITQPGLPTEVEHVRIMSLHKAKGLTTRAVVLIGCVNGLLPRKWSPTKTAMSEAEHEKEQRRLLYVAVTRTTKYILVSGFRSAPKAEALRMGMPSGIDEGPNFRYTISRFFVQLGVTIPRFSTTRTFPD